MNNRMNSLFKYDIVILLVAVLLMSCIGTDNEQLKGYVPDEKTAITVAEAVWLPIYGKSIYNYKPFKATLKSEKIWIVQGTLKQGKGGVPYIEIQKEDCKILKVIHGK